ncbi:ABC transporter permease subunit [Halopiger goleimassiliensis]|uniref:ABC transporter permease subunit n=1 Tax=Halopiger goleimassiliensis TaxID=1293048 RepID=UPI0006780F61|nr:ABC transporter permease subunit [Halopiger goleimassiliensis]
MAWTPIARKDHLEMRDSRLVRWLVYLFVVVCLLGGYVFPVVTGGAVTTDRFAGFMTESIGLLLPLLGILFGYNAIVGERESGRLTLVLSMPHDRADVVLGKVAGRGGYLVVAVVAGLVGAAALVVYPFGSLSVGPYLVFLLLTLGFAGIYFGIGLAISTWTRSKQRATIVAFGVFFLFVVVWDAVREIVAFGLEQLGVANGDLPNPVLFLHGAEPGLLYDRLVTAFVAGGEGGPYLEPTAPWYLGEWVGLVLFCSWLVVPIAAGYRRFARTDL